MKLSSLTLSLLALAGVASFAQTPTITSKAGATILSDTGITRVPTNDKGPGEGYGKLAGIDLYFGRFLKPTANGTAVLAYDATYATTPAGYKGGAYTPGYELTTGAANMAVTVSGPGAAIQVISDQVPTGGTATATQKMTVSNFTFGLTGGTGNEGTNGVGGNGSFVTGTNKKVHFNVGATLNLNAGQEPGLYTGTYTLTTAYN